MTIDEAITHCYEVAKTSDCECAKEHLQLAQWLKELKKYKEQKSVLTEQEYIQSCNTEQLAEFLCDVWYGIDEVINIMSEDGEISKKDAMKLWLKQPHRDKE